MCFVLQNKSPPGNGKYNKSFSNITTWKVDKVKINKGKITKIEIYNYFYKKDLKKMIKFLHSKKFKYTTDKNTYLGYWNILLNQEGKYITGQGKIIDISNNIYKYYYYVHFCRTLVHRNRVFLFKIYENKSTEKDFFKLEITYGYFKKNYYPHFIDWMSALKGINEIIRRLEKRFTAKGYSEDFSQQIILDSFINSVKDNKNSRNRDYSEKIINNFIN